MEKTNLLRPFERLHDKLRDVVNGKKDLNINAKRLGDLAVGEDLKRIAEEAYEDESEFLGDLKPYVGVDKPLDTSADSVESYLIKQTLSELGREVYEHVNGGFVWNLTTREIDMDATTAFYRDMMDKGSIEVRYMELVIENKDDRMADLRSYMTYFKLGGNRVKKGQVEVIEKIKDAA